VDAHVSLVFRFPAGLVFWAAYLLVFAPEFVVLRRSGRKLAGAQDAGTLRLILIGQQAALAAGVGASFLRWGLIPRPEAALAVGTCVMLAGGALRRLCFRALGRYFTGAVVVVPGQPVVERGPYRWVRHPSYSAGMLIFAGIAISLGSWVSVAVLTVVPFLVYLRRVRVEEAALVETIGEPYRAYMARTGRFIPFVV
jgi:protein-S-isoprenylcysteine O-methyltransferase Ste14